MLSAKRTSMTIPGIAADAEYDAAIRQYYMPAQEEGAGNLSEWCGKMLMSKTRDDVGTVLKQRVLRLLSIASCCHPANRRGRIGSGQRIVVVNCCVW